MALTPQPFLRCTECKSTLNFQEHYIIDYFKDKSPIQCPKCGARLDRWKVILAEIKENFMFNQVFTPIGAKSTVFKIKLKPNESTTYRFSDYSIPENAKILYINYTPRSHGGTALFPVELHGNISTRRFIGRAITVFPVPFGTGEIGEADVSVYVTWILHSADDESWQNLVDAFEAYASERYESTIVPANVAVESILSRFLTTFLGRFTSKKQIEEFLSNAATYSYQLNVLLPLIVNLCDSIKLPEHIRGSLNKLRNLRNQIAHKGYIEVKLPKDDAAEILCAALFGFRYIRLIESELEKDS